MVANRRRTRRFRRKPTHRHRKTRKNRWIEAAKPKFIVNLSTHTLSKPELDALAKGLNFVPNTRDRPSTAEGYYRLKRTLRLRYFFRNEEPQNLVDNPFRKKSMWDPPPANQEIESYLAQLPDKLKGIQQQEFRHNLSQEEIRATISLSHNTDLVIRKADKGSCTVVEDKKQYIADGLGHLQDELVYKELQDDPTAALTTAIHNYVDSLSRRGYLKQRYAGLLEGCQTREHTDAKHVLPQENSQGRA